MRKIHLAWFSGKGEGVTPSPGYDPLDPQLYIDVARLCERFKLDMCLIGDTLAIANQFRGSHDYYVESGRGLQNPMDPIPLMAAMAAHTSRIGLAATISTTFTHPYTVSRALSTLDHISRGRIGWNVVTSWSSLAAQNYGIDEIPPHDTRYDMADEYLAACRALWQTWDADARFEDRTDGRFADPAKVRPAHFKGKYYSTRGPLNIPPSPQGRPTLIMAGASPRGRRFAVENTDALIAHLNSVEDMAAYTKSIRTQLSDAGRDPKSCKVFYAIKPILGETMSIANERNEALNDMAKLENGLATLSDNMGHDLSQYPLDEPLPTNLEQRAVQGKFDQYHISEGKGPTLREMALHEARNLSWEIVGTPEHVADVLIDAAERGDIDGFHVRAGYTNYRYCAEFLTKVVPELQRRGAFRTEYSGNTLRDHLNEY